MRIRIPIAATLALCAAMAFLPLRAGAQPPAANAAPAHRFTIPQSGLIQPARLAAMIRSGHAPAIFQVGFRTLYEEAHIQGAPYAGPASTSAGRERLRKTVAHLNRNKLIVIYCGCCPWPKCPNIRPAYEELRKMGFTHVKAVYIPHNFGTDWVSHGYPTVKGD